MSGKGSIIDELNVDATMENIDVVRDWVMEKIEDKGFGMKEQLQLEMAIEELFVNIVHYAYNPTVGGATVRVEVTDDPVSVIITFIDNGVPFDPLAKADPSTNQEENEDVGGLGIFMVKNTMDDVKYEYKDGQNILLIQKNA